MAREKKVREPLPTIWHADDGLWAEVPKVLAARDPPAAYGPERIDQRAAFDGVIFRMRSGCQWNLLPAGYGDDASVHRTFQRWVTRGVPGKLWAVLVKGCEELGGADWRRQSADCASGKARGGGEKGRPQPDRPGQERHETRGPDRGRRGAGGGRLGPGQPSRLAGTAGHPGGGRGRPARPGYRPDPAPVPGQGVRRGAE